LEHRLENSLFIIPGEQK